MPLDHFSLVAPFYDWVFGGMPSDRLHALLDLPAEGWLLDAGGGTGRIAETLRGQVGGMAVVDVSPGMVARARHKADLNASQARVQQLPFADDAFDRIIVVDAWHHFDDQPGAVREMVRVLAPGGRLVVEDFNIDRFGVKLLALGEHLLLMGSRFHTPAQMRQLFAPHASRVTVHDEHALNYWVVVEK